jgi:alcohol dehydrogenase
MTTLGAPIKTAKTNGAIAKNHNTETMHALVYHGAGKKSWEEKPKPLVKEPTDAIVKILKTTICGTDLHIMKGDLPEVAEF